MFAEALRAEALASTTCDEAGSGCGGCRQPAGARRQVPEPSRAGAPFVGSLPVHVTFPAFGPSIFLASELTAEGSAPSIDLAFKRTRS